MTHSGWLPGCEISRRLYKGDPWVAGTNQISLISRDEQPNPEKTSMCKQTDSEPACAHMNSEKKLFQRGLAEHKTRKTLFKKINCCGGTLKGHVSLSLTDKNQEPALRLFNSLHVNMAGETSVQLGNISFTLVVLRKSLSCMRKGTPS